MSKIESFYKPVYQEFNMSSLYEIKPPTCAMFEPNFEKVFNSGTFDSNSMIDEQGNILASLFEQEEVYGLKKWLPFASSNASTGPLLIKNPFKIAEYEELIGIRNGLVCTA